MYGPAQVGYGVGYVRVPRLGVIEALHALHSHTGRTVCGQLVAISWSAEDAADTEIDCQDCLAAIGQKERNV
jgi:hypothetical protein